MKRTVKQSLGMCLLMTAVAMAAPMLSSPKMVLRFLPKDIYEAGKYHPKPSLKKRMVGHFLVLILCVYIARACKDNTDRIKNERLGFGKAFIRLLTFWYIEKAYDIAVLDQILCMSSGYYQHFYPETKDCIGWKNRSWNKKQQLTRLVLMPVICAVWAYVCTCPREMNPFIKQFGRPTGLIGRLFGKMMTLSNKKMHKAVLAEIGSSGRMLEIGFGSGSQLEMIHSKHPDIELYGIDISKEMLTMAQKSIGNFAILSQCSCEKTDYEDNFFDMVISTDSCYFWKDPQKVLREIRRITRPSGILVLAYNSMYAKAVHKSDSSLGMFDDESISREVKKAGMKIISNKTCGFKQKILTIGINGDST